MPLNLTKTEDASYPELPISAMLHGVITSIETKDVVIKGKPVTLVEIMAEIDEPDIQEGVIVKGSASAKLSPKSKLNKWVTAMRGGREPGVGETIDLEQFLGNNVQFILDANDKPGENGQPPMRFYNIVDFIAVRQPAQGRNRTDGRQF